MLRTSLFEVLRLIPHELWDKCGINVGMRVEEVLEMCGKSGHVNL